MLRIEKIAHHRNGVAGSPFYVVLFKRGREKFLATMFYRLGDSLNLSTSVLDRDLLAQGVIEFAQNSWVAEEFERELRHAVMLWEFNGKPAKGVGNRSLCAACINRPLDNEDGYCAQCRAEAAAAA